MITTRRSLIGGLASLFAAPAIVRADSLMKVHTREWFAKERQIITESEGITNLVSFGALNDWREQQRPELGSVRGRKWADEQIRLNRENGRHTYHDVHWKYCPLT